MTTTFTIDELREAAGRALEPGPWRTIDQQRIDLFADATDDHQWIHVDPTRAAAGPFGATIAHGYLTLSLVAPLVEEVLEVTDAAMIVNYGVEKIRFPAPVPSGSRIRLHATIASVEARAGGLLYTVSVSVEVEGQEKPALVGTVLYLAR